MADQTPDLAAIEARVTAATPGPWRASETWRPKIGRLPSEGHPKWPNRADGSIFWGYSVSGSDQYGASILPTLAAVHNFPDAIEANATFIAHARADIPALLAHIARLTAERDAAVADRDALRAGEYLIWSNENRAWWRPDSAGYTRHIESAGRYTRERAIGIARDCRDGWFGDAPPTEIAVPLADVMASWRAALTRTAGADHE